MATLLFGAMLFTFQPSVSAITSKGLEGIQKNGPWYGEDENAGTCTESYGASGVGTLPGGIPEPWNGLISEAAPKFKANASMVAAALYWENRGFPNPKKTWATSPAGAQGPMQFMPGTWAAYKEDGNGDGNPDVLNPSDAIHGGARYVAALGGAPETPLGDLNRPLAANTLLRVAASYNWGPGNVASAGESATLDALPNETSDYLKAIYVLIDSNFSKKPASNSNLPTSSDSNATTGLPAGQVGGGNCGTEAAELGPGKGNFTDNTAIKVANYAQVMAKAQEISKYSLEELNTKVCDNVDVGCNGGCERLAAVVHGRTNSGHTTANAHWYWAVSRGLAHPGDRNVPPGALLYYDTGRPEGHVAVYLGNNKLISNDILDAQKGITGGAYITDAESIETIWSSTKYLGWVEPSPWL